MIDGLSDGARRALALAILAGLLLVAGGVVAVPAWLAYRERAGLAAIERRIAELRGRLPGREGLLAEERLLGRGEGLERALLRGSTPAVAAAGLQGDLTALASAMGATVASVQILDPEAASPFTEVGLRLTMGADISTLRDFLYAVETREPVLVLRSFSLARADGAGGDQILPGGTEPLTATLQIHGYLAGTPEALGTLPAGSGVGGG